jgi:hypothetical protein
LPEAAHPYYVLAPHVKIDFASPAGPNPPVDEYSVKASSDEESVKFLNDPTVKAKLAGAKKLSDVAAEDYDAIFYVGGHGPVLDLASDPVNAKLASQASTMCFEFLGLNTPLTPALFTVLERGKNCRRRLPWSSVRIVFEVQLVAQANVTVG